MMVAETPGMRPATTADWIGPLKRMMVDRGLSAGEAAMEEWLEDFANYLEVWGLDADGYEAFKGAVRGEYAAGARRGVAG